MMSVLKSKITIAELCFSPVSMLVRGSISSWTRFLRLSYISCGIQNDVALSGTKVYPYLDKKTCMYDLTMKSTVATYQMSAPWKALKGLQYSLNHYWILTVTLWPWQSKLYTIIPLFCFLFNTTVVVKMALIKTTACERSWGEGRGGGKGPLPYKRAGWCIHIILSKSNQKVFHIATTAAIKKMFRNARRL